jgi:hypothetical protein
MPFRELRAAAGRRRAVFVPVRLLCNETQLVQRVVSPERAARLKGMNPEAAACAVRTRDVLKVNHANAMTMDTSDISPQESARRILAHIEACLRSAHSGEIEGLRPLSASTRDDRGA